MIHVTRRPTFSPTSRTTARRPGRSDQRDPARSSISRGVRGSTCSRRFRRALAPGGGASSSRRSTAGARMRSPTTSVADVTHASAGAPGDVAADRRAPRASRRSRLRLLHEDHRGPRAGRRRRRSRQRRDPDRGGRRRRQARRRRPVPCRAERGGRCRRPPSPAREDLLGGGSGVSGLPTDARSTSASGWTRFTYQIRRRPATAAVARRWRRSSAPPPGGRPGLKQFVLASHAVLDGALTTVCSRSSTEMNGALRFAASWRSRRSSLVCDASSRIAIGDRP